MNIIGITGGIGSGKSLAASFLKELTGSDVIFTDDVAKKLMDKGNTIYYDVIDKFGEDILDTDKSINREKLSKIIFADNNKRLMLNELSHKHVLDEVNRLIKEAEDSGRKSIFIESALFKEAKFEDICDEIWLVYTPVEARIKRLVSDRGYSVEKCGSIINNQPQDDEFKESSDVIIINDGSTEDLKEKIKIILTEKGMI